LRAIGESPPAHRVCGVLDLGHSQGSSRFYPPPRFPSASLPLNTPVSGPGRATTISWVKDGGAMRHRSGQEKDGRWRGEMRHRSGQEKDRRWRGEKVGSPQ
jgi:hypothetical protein